MFIKKFQDYAAVYYDRKEELFKTGYKFLEQIKSDTMLSKVTVLENGCPKVIYFTDGLQSLLSVLPKLSEQKAWECICQILVHVKKMDESGFLCKESILIQPQYLFYNIVEEKIKWIVIPKSSVTDDEREKWIHDCMDLIYILGERIQAEKITCFYHTVNEVLEKRKGWDVLEEWLEQSEKNEEPLAANKKLRIENAVYGIVFEVEQEEYVLGKHPELVDGCIQVSSAVSRRHCKVRKLSKTTFGVIDLGSVNGTFVNGIRVSSEIAAEVKDGDILRLADVEFRIRIESGE